ncbi:hypothetical protein Acy02nite_06450 [Actinoplanes cyaneus]|uniref:Uncharacterized protein n=1 Tax=Actinoplanes cyaneus TaxID=52696 RepID=A0A919M4X3_9ACTN|nr:hypothetical protein Acy02nite_06450 [Actinoplanes cyaneus]
MPGQGGDENLVRLVGHLAGEQAEDLAVLLVQDIDDVAPGHGALDRRERGKIHVRHDRAGTRYAVPLKPVRPPRPPPEDRN